MDKILTDRTHDVSIYSINTPLMSQADIMQVVEDTSVAIQMWYWIVAGFLSLLGVGSFLYYRIVEHKKEEPLSVVTTDSVKEELAANDNNVENENLELKVEAGDERIPVLRPIENYFDRSRSAISLLGTFNVRDKDGNDITSNFTPRLKSLLVLLILYTEKDEKGILTRKVTDMLWSDKDEISARNNRNVTLRKLRVLLEEVGDVEVVSDGGFLKMQWKEKVFCDYRTALHCIELFQRNGSLKDDVFLNQILELLLCGPLLSNTIVDWLDGFKDAYSSLSIDLLRNLLDIEYKKNNHEMVLRITDIMFLHDPLNEEALSAKCLVLFSEGKKGIAKSDFPVSGIRPHGRLGLLAARVARKRPRAAALNDPLAQLAFRQPQAGAQCGRETADEFGQFNLPEKLARPVHGFPRGHIAQATHAEGHALRRIPAQILKNVRSLRP